jgi:hypothetical protein
MIKKYVKSMSIFKKINDHQKFAESILEQIQKLPFGSLPKKELELVILHSLIISLEHKNKNSYEGVNNHFSDLMIGLKLSQTQLRNKILDAQLRFDSCEEIDVENNILHSIVEGKCSIEDKYIVFSIFNPLLFELTKSYFERRNIISDTSFGKTIFKINLKGFILFINQLDSLTSKHKVELGEILKDAEKEGLIKLSSNRSEKSKLDNIESLTTIGNNLFDIISKLSPFLTSLFV